MIFYNCHGKGKSFSGQKKAGNTRKHCDLKPSGVEKNSSQQWLADKVDYFFYYLVILI